MMVFQFPGVGSYRFGVRQVIANLGVACAVLLTIVIIRVHSRPQSFNACLGMRAY